MNGNMSYKERNQGINLGEKLFEDYCNARGYKVIRIGFDEKNNPIDGYYKLPYFIRNLPDYLVVRDDKMFLIMVKGTANIKKTEVDQIPFFCENYSSKECMLLYAFCFAGQKKPLFITPDRVIELYQQATDKQWSDGKVYRTLKLNE